jgi:hypothetical protein
MPSLLRCLLSVATVLLTGCYPNIYTDVPLGEPAQFKSGEWDGLWLCAPEDLIRVRTGVPGIRDPAITESWRECDTNQAGLWQPLKLPRHTSTSDRSPGEFRHYRNWYFMPCEGGPATGKPCDISFFAQRIGTVVYGYGADHDRIRKLLDEGKISGRIESVQSGDHLEERLVLHSLTADHYKLLFELHEGVLGQPIGFCIRVPPELDPCDKLKQSPLQ